MANVIAPNPSFLPKKILCVVLEMDKQVITMCDYYFEQFSCRIKTLGPTFPHTPKPPTPELVLDLRVRIRIRIVILTPTLTIFLSLTLRSNTNSHVGGFGVSEKSHSQKPSQQQCNHFLGFFSRRRPCNHSVVFFVRRAARMEGRRECISPTYPSNVPGIIQSSTHLLTFMPGSVVACLLKFYRPLGAITRDLNHVI